MTTIFIVLSLENIALNNEYREIKEMSTCASVCLKLWSNVDYINYRVIKQKVIM
jgi:hypothetical protein